MYPEGFRTFVEPGVSADPMEGAGRPGHFRGVATVVVKLLNAVQPHKAYFGRKDFQQLAVVNETVSALNIDVQIVGVPTVREGDGLALSSRNVRLSQAARAEAPVIFKALRAAREAYQNGERNRSVLEQIATEILLTAPLCKIEYVTECDAKTLQSSNTAAQDSVMCVACWFDDVRLIDNVALS
jgi:pantoate--beta-alanine ligase